MCGDIDVVLISNGVCIFIGTWSSGTNDRFEMLAFMNGDYDIHECTVT